MSGGVSDGITLTFWHCAIEAQRSGHLSSICSRGILQSLGPGTGPAR